MNSEATPETRIRTILNQLVPTERKVAEIVLSEPEKVVEATAQELATMAGVARSSVIRTSQSLGYPGYPQLRVALAKQLAVTSGSTDSFENNAYGKLLENTSRMVHHLPQAFSIITAEQLETVTDRIMTSRRVLSVANGLSAPLALDFSMRLTAVGRHAEYVGDPIGQQIAARHLSQQDTAIILSGSGATEASLKSAKAARQAGATVIAVTSFVSSPLVDLADEALVISTLSGAFLEELEYTSRIAHSILTSSLVNAVAAKMGEVAREAHTSVLEILGEHLSD